MKHPDEPGLGLAARSSMSPEFLAPTMAKYGLLQEAMIGLSEVSGATTTVTNEQMHVDVERTFIDTNLATAPYIIRLSMEETSFPAISWSILAISYAESSLHHAVRGTRLEHAYHIEQQEGKVTQSWQSIHVFGPESDRPPAESEVPPDVKQFLQAEDGLRILMRNFGKRVLLSAGDCDVLHERMMLLKRA